MHLAGLGGDALENARQLCEDVQGSVDSVRIFRKQLISSKSNSDAMQIEFQEVREDRCILNGLTITSFQCTTI